MRFHRRERTRALHCTPLSLMASITESTALILLRWLALRVGDMRHGDFLEIKAGGQLTRIGGASVRLAIKDRRSTHYLTGKLQTLFVLMMGCWISCRTGERFEDTLEDDRISGATSGRSPRYFPTDPLGLVSGRAVEMTDRGSVHDGESVDEYYLDDTIAVPLQATTSSNSMSFTPQVRAASGRMSCQICRTIVGNTARRQWQVSRSIHLSRATIYPSTAHTTHGLLRSLRPLQRFASTTPLKSGPAINIPEFPSHSRPAPVAPSKHEIHGTAPSFDALKADEDWGEGTELVHAEEAKIFVTEPALKVCIGDLLSFPF